MIISKQKRIALVLAVLLLLSLGCSAVTVTNNSGEDVRLALTIPDGGGMTVTRLSPQAVKVKTSVTGGTYMVTALKSRELIDQLTSIRDSLKAELAKPQLTPENVQKIKQDIQTLQILLEETEKENSKALGLCAGSVPDWGAVEAVITESNGKFVVSCTVDKPEISISDIVNGGQ